MATMPRPLPQAPRPLTLDLSGVPDVAPPKVPTLSLDLSGIPDAAAPVTPPQALPVAAVPPVAPAIPAMPAWPAQEPAPQVPNLHLAPGESSARLGYQQPVSKAVQQFRAFKRQTARATAEQPAPSDAAKALAAGTERFLKNVELGPGGTVNVVGDPDEALAGAMEVVNGANQAATPALIASGVGAGPQATLRMAGWILASQLGGKAGQVVSEKAQLSPGAAALVETALSTAPLAAAGVDVSRVKRAVQNEARNVVLATKLAGQPEVLEAPTVRPPGPGVFNEPITPAPYGETLGEVVKGAIDLQRSGVPDFSEAARHTAALEAVSAKPAPKVEAPALDLSAVPDAPAEVKAPPEAKPTGRPTEETNIFVRDAKERETQIAALRQHVAGASAVSFKQPNGVTLMVSPDPSKPGRFRSTTFQADGTPSGHAEFATFDDAVLSSAGYFDSTGAPPIGFRSSTTPDVLSRESEGPAPGMVRVYRGGESHGPARWFNADRERAEIYAEFHGKGKKGDVHYLDIPEAQYHELLEEGRLAGDKTGNVFLPEEQAKGMRLASAATPTPAAPEAPAPHPATEALTAAAKALNEAVAALNPQTAKAEAAPEAPTLPVGAKVRYTDQGQSAEGEVTEVGNGWATIKKPNGGFAWKPVGEVEAVSEAPAAAEAQPKADEAPSVGLPGEEFHNFIKSQVAEGKAVPPEVFEQYPDLKPAPAPEPSKATAPEAKPEAPKPTEDADAERSRREARIGESPAAVDEPVRALGVAYTDIPHGLAQRAHEGTSWSPEVRANMEQREYVRHMNRVWDALTAKAHADQADLVAAEFQKYRENYLLRYKLLLGRRSRLISSAITGPSKFPVRRAEKLHNGYEKAQAEFLAWDAKAQKAMRETVAPTPPRAISADRSDAVDALQAKIADAEALQGRMKAANAIVKRKGLTNEQKIDALKRETKLADKTAYDLLKPDYMGRIGFPEYALTNNAANIRRMKARIAEIATTRGTAERTATFDGGTIEENAGANRIQITFDSKAEGKKWAAQLRRHGFKWAPSQGVWQRQRTAAAVQATESLFNVKLAAPEAPAAPAEEAVSVPAALTTAAEAPTLEAGVPDVRADEKPSADSPAHSDVAATGQDTGRGAEASVPGSRVSDARRDDEGDRLFARELDRARAAGFDGDPAAIRPAFDTALSQARELVADLSADLRDTAAEFGDEAILQVIADAGGIAEPASEGTYPEIARAFWDASTGSRDMKTTSRGRARGVLYAPFGNIAGVKRVVVYKKDGGKDLDTILEAVQESGKAPEIETIQDLEAWLGRFVEKERNPTRLRLVGKPEDYLDQFLGEHWWAPAGAEDFNVAEMEAAPVIDQTEAGLQPRLPEAGAVREQDIATPEFEAPFSLEREAVKTKAVQENLFGAPPKPARAPLPKKPERSSPNTPLFSGVDPGFNQFYHEDLKPLFGPLANGLKAIGQAVPRIVINILEPALPVRKAKTMGESVYAATMRMAHAPDVARLQFDAQQAAAFDATFAELETFFNQFPESQLKAFNLTRGNPETVPALNMQDLAVRELAAAKDRRLADPRLIAAIRETSDYVWQLAKDAGFDDLAYFQDYFYGTYKGSHERIDNFLTHWRTTERWTKEKTFPTIADAAAFGLDLRHPNPVTNIKAELHAVAQRIALKGLRDGTILEPPAPREPVSVDEEFALAEPKPQKRVREETPRPVVRDTARDYAVWQDEANEMQRREWLPIQEPLFRGLLFDSRYARLVNGLISANKITRSPLLSSIRQAGYVAQQFKFFGSLFHYQNMAKGSIATEAGGLLNPKGYQDFYRANTVKIDPLDPEYLDYVALGGGHRYSLESQAQTQMSIALEKVARGNLLGAALRLPRAALQQPWIPASPGFIQWMFDSMIPAMKFAKYQHDVAALTAKYGRPLKDWEKIAIIRRQQNFHGEMNERLFGRSGTVTSALRLVFMAPGYGEGNFRTMFKAGGGDLHSARFIVQTLLLTLTATTLFTRLLTGEWPDVPTDIRDVRDLFKVKTTEKDPQGRTVYYDLMTYDKDYWSIAGNLATAQPERIGGELRARLGGATSVTFRLLTDLSLLFQNRMIFNFQNQPVFLKTDPVGVKLVKLAEHWGKEVGPISGSVFFQGQTAGMSPAKSLALSVAGLRPAKSEAEKRESEAYVQARDDLARKQLAQGQEKRDIRELLQRAGRAAAQSRAKESSLTRRQIENTFKTANAPHLDVQFGSLPLAQALELYAEMSPGDRARVRWRLELKYSRALKAGAGTPDLAARMTQARKLPTRR